MEMKLMTEEINSKNFQFIHKNLFEAENGDF